MKLPKYTKIKMFHAVSEEGEVCWSSSANNEIKHLPDGIIEGLTSSSLGIIKIYNLNSDDDIKFRNNSTELQSVAKYYTDDTLQRTIVIFIGTLWKINTLNKNCAKHTKHRADAYF
ncbi:MAG: hypothetical protein ACRBCI_14825 [Cellvibrionaceae bacterium]